MGKKTERTKEEIKRNKEEGVKEKKGIPLKKIVPGIIAIGVLVAVVYLVFPLGEEAETPETLSTTTPAPTTSISTTSTPTTTVAPSTTAPPDIELRGLYLKKEVFRPGENVRIYLKLYNSGGRGDTTLTYSYTKPIIDMSSRTTYTDEINVSDVPHGYNNDHYVHFEAQGIGEHDFEIGEHMVVFRVEPESPTTVAPTTTPSPNKGPTLKLGESTIYEMKNYGGQTERWEISVTKCDQLTMYRSDYGTDFEPTQGMKYLFIYVKQRNKNETIQRAPSWDVTVEYDGKIYHRFFFYEEKYGAKDQASDDFIYYGGDVKPNETNEGWVPIEVPVNIDFRDAKVNIYTSAMEWNTIEELEDNPIASWEFSATPTTRETPEPKPEVPGHGEYRVKYVVEGTADEVDVTYASVGGGTAQESNVSVPWEYTFKTERGEFLYISAQNCGKSGTVTVKIYVDEHLYKETTSSGAYVIATASGSAGD